jgi:hypothetical protein
MTTDYYLNAATGDDASCGTSPEAAWQSLARVNATIFQPGGGAKAGAFL